MKIIVLLENTSRDPSLVCEHGLSLYLEAGGHRVLFDMGQSAAFAANAEALGVDLTAVEAAVLSHGHYDHGGGLSTFLSLNATAPVYLSPFAFEPHFNGKGAYIGLDGALAPSPRLIPAADGLDLFGDGVFTLYAGESLPCPHPVDSAGLTVGEGADNRPEDFRHEQYLLVREGGRAVLFSGCSHRGILNICRHFVPDLCVGGFHFKHLDPDGEGRAVLDAAADELLALPTHYCTLHCTGEAAYRYLSAPMGSRLVYLSTGDTLEYPAY